MSTNEKGHARNAALLEKLIEEIVGYGTAYSPANSAISLISLSSRRDEVLAILEDYKVAKVNLIDAVNVRQEVYTRVVSICSFIVAEAIACGADKKTIDDMHSITRLIHGSRAKKLPKEEASVTPQPVDPAEGEKAPESDPASKLKRSVSHTSYDNRLANFATLAELTKKVPGYNPSESHLTTANLENLVSESHHATKNVNITIAAIENIRMSRDKLLYHPETGAIALVARVKAYVLVLFGPDSYEYKSLVAMPFKQFDYRGL